MAEATLSLEGALDFNRVPAVWRQGCETIEQQPQASLTIDLSAVTQCDSAALAMLIDWQRRAAKKQLQLNFRQAPQQLHAIAALCNLNHLLS